MSGAAEVRSILRQAMPPARRFVPALLAGVLSAAAAIGLLLVSGWLIVSASIVDSLVPLSVAVVGVRFFAVSRAVFRYLERLAGHDAALRQLAGLRSGIVRRLTPLSPAGLGGTDRGAVLSVLIYDHAEAMNYAAAHRLSAILLVFAFAVLFVVYSISRRFRAAKP